MLFRSQGNRIRADLDFIRRVDIASDSFNATATKTGLYFKDTTSVRAISFYSEGL